VKNARARRFWTWNSISASAFQFIAFILRNHPLESKLVNYTLFNQLLTQASKLPEPIFSNWDFLAIGGDKIELFNKFFAIIFGKISRKRKGKIIWLKSKFLRT
jgi:hypothetical protein